MSHLEARREARRRKILENAEIRLKKITNKDDIFEEQRTSSKTPLNFQSSLNEFSKRSGSNIPSPPKKEVDNSRIRHEGRVSFDLANDLRTIYQTPIPEDNSSLEVELQEVEEQKSILRDWIIVLLALIVRYLFLVSEQYPRIISKNFLFKYHFNKIFIPFFLYQITEYAFFKPFVYNNGFLNILYVLNLRVPVETIHKIVIIIRVLLRITQDMMVYFFVFVSVDQLIVFITQETN